MKENNKQIIERLSPVNARRWIYRNETKIAVDYWKKKTKKLKK